MENTLSDIIYPSPKNGNPLIPAAFTVRDIYEKYKLATKAPFTYNKVRH